MCSIGSSLFYIISLCFWLYTVSPFLGLGEHSLDFTSLLTPAPLLCSSSRQNFLKSLSTWNVYQSLSLIRASVHSSHLSHHHSNGTCPYCPHGSSSVPIWILAFESADLSLTAAVLYALGLHTAFSWVSAHHFAFPFSVSLSVSLSLSLPPSRPSSLPPSLSPLLLYHFQILRYLGVTFST